MTYYVTAFTNDRAQLFVNQTRTTDAIVADMVADHMAELGYIVVRYEED